MATVLWLIGLTGIVWAVFEAQRIGYSRGVRHTREEFRVSWVHTPRFAEIVDDVTQTLHLNEQELDNRKYEEVAEIVVFRLAQRHELRPMRLK